MKAPEAPDPRATAQAQGEMNRETAITQYLLNATNQVTPWGSLNYSQTGNTFTPSKNGQTYYYNAKTGEYSANAPRITGYATTPGTPARNSPSTFSLLNGGRDDNRNRNNRGGGGTASTRTPIYEKGWEQVQGILTPKFTATQTLDPKIQSVINNAINQMQKPFDISNEAVESRLMELGRKRLDPALDRRRASTEQDLYNRGVRMGSEAYDRSMEGLSQGENDAYTQLLLNGRGQAVNEAQLARSIPLNEAIALATGGQSGYINTPGTQVAPVDYTGLVNQKYQGELANYQSGMSGLFGLGSTLLGGFMMSDERLKTDKKKVGETDDGIGVYKYRYKGSPMMQIGVMAQDVEKKKPHAVVTTPSGYKAVHYPTAMGA